MLSIFSSLSSLPLKLRPDKRKLDQIYSSLHKHYDDSPDPWGLDVNYHRKLFECLWPFYKSYFRVRVHGKENIRNVPYMIVSNHSGQIAIDGMLIMMAFIYDITPPRLVRAMVERFLPGLPFLGEMVAHSGSILGDRKNCQYLLEKNESVLVFPEGVKGIAKNTSEFYQLQDFTSGFLRMALKTKTDILPVAVVGAEEFYPYVVHMRKLASLLGLPALPVTPTFPWFGLLGLMPLPSPVDIYIGKPYPAPKDLSPEAPDKEINEHVFRIENQVQTLLSEGLEHKRNFLGVTKKSSKKAQK